MKQKTNKAAHKRFTTSARGKIRRRVVNQSHFNAKDTGKETRRKHSSAIVDPSDKSHIKQLLPYN
ncbi:MAG: 50S ribosomal protein L35 [bacterium]